MNEGNFTKVLHYKLYCTIHYTTTYYPTTTTTTLLLLPPLTY